MTRPRTGFAYLDAGLEEGTVLAMAHRGGAGHPDLAGVENTLRAFTHAVALGYEYLETDVHATRDGVLLAFHDDTLERLTGHPGRIRDLTATEAGAVLVASREPLPRFTDLLEAFPEVRFNVDLKTPSSVDPMLDLLHRTGWHDRMCIVSFHEPTIRRFRRLVDRPVVTSRGVLATGVNSGWVPFGRLLEPLLHDDGAAYQVPHFHFGRRLVDAGFVERAHRLGRHVHVWTIDDPAEMDQLLDLGVDGLITDRTDLLRDVLVRRGSWPGSA